METLHIIYTLDNSVVDGTGHCTYNFVAHFWDRAGHALRI